MSSSQDPFYIVKEEIQESIDELEATFHQWEKTPSNTGERVHLTREIIASCESIEWQVDELNKTITVAARDPAYYGLDDVEIEKRRKWTTTAQSQVGIVRKAIEVGKNSSINSSISGAHQGLVRLPDDRATQAGRSNHYIARDDDDFISSESDRQQLLMKEQDEELDEISASIQRIGGVGLTIHEELSGQERILDGLSLEMESTSNRLSSVQVHFYLSGLVRVTSEWNSLSRSEKQQKQKKNADRNVTQHSFTLPDKKIGGVMKKAGAKGQIMMIAILVLLFVILFVLVFLT